MSTVGPSLEATVYLECVKKGSKLRIRIISPGYNNEANCTFPKAIREVGRKYSVPSSAISFTENSSMKFFYRIKPKDITILNEDIDITIKQPAKTLKVYEDVSVEDCVICFDKKKSIVFSPCGHYCTCDECAKIIMRSKNKCPICRAVVKVLVERDKVLVD